MLCNQTPSNEIGWSFPAAVAFESTLVISDEEASASGVHIGESALKRYLGCMILMFLPENGVDEAFNWLFDSWKFYAHTIPATRPVAVTQAPIEVTVEPAILRPSLGLTEE